MGPQHPSTHGVLRLILEIDGETVTETRAGIGYLHTGHREEHGVPDVDPGRHVLHPHGLPDADVPGDGLLPRRREAARRHRPDPRAGQRDPGPDDGADPDLLAPGGAGHRRHGDGRDDRHDGRLPRARADPRGDRADHRPADEQRLHPSGRRLAGHPERRDRPDPRHGPGGPQGRPRARAAAAGEPDPQGPHRRRRLPRPHRLHRPRHHRPGAAGDRPAARPAQAGRRTAATRPTTSTSSPGRAATPTAGSASGWTRSTSRSRSSSRPPTGCSTSTAR